MSSKYEQRGVSASKSEVHAAIKNLDKGLFPNAFCKILPDFAGGSDEHVNIMHADTAGTKTSLAYLYWKETGDTSVWKGIVQDSMVMNLDDMACAGMTDNFILSSTIGRNKNLVTGEVVSVLINAATELADQLAEYGINIRLAGGETADVGDIVRTADVGFTAFGRMPKAEVLDIDVQPGDAIVGFASFGQASYEQAYNSGIGSNGLTFARHETLSKQYAQQYPECFDPSLPDEVVFTGKASLTDSFEDAPLNVGQLLLSPTRTYVPLIAKMLEGYRKEIHGLIHATGGGMTKVLHFSDRLRMVKDNLFEPPHVFRLIQSQSGADWKEMYQVFNMGQRLEAYVNPAIAEELITMAKGFGIDARIIGHCEAAEGKEVLIKSALGEFSYQA